MNRKFRILLVSNGFYPEISARSFRATELAVEFARQGHEVKVISKYRDYDYSGFLNENPIDLVMWDRSRCPEIPDFRGRLGKLISRTITRLLGLLFEYPSIENMFKVRKILKDENGFDLMISFAVPHPVHWGVAWAKSIKHQISDKWIADCGDPYMGDILDTFRHPFYFKYFEKWFCRKADYITVPIEGALKGYYPEFHHKIRVIPQGFNFSLDNYDQSEPVNDVPSFAYAGELMPGVRDPEPLMRFLTTVDFPFRFYIFTNRTEIAEKYKVQLKDKLVICGYIPRNELMNIFSGMDFLINFDNNSDRNSPSKLIDYAIAGRPVLNIKKEFAAEKVFAFIKGDYSGRMTLPDVSNYHIGKISRIFLEFAGND
ncbi:MAG: glycosyltransferase family 4 protein [Bacteroidales bacterium]|nr:glycosyltransferase family 4 protein [Bacteroidales bacterium]